MKVLALQVVQDQLVFHLEVAELLVGVVQQSVVSPPGDPRQGSTTQGCAAKPDSVSDLVRAQLQPDFRVVIRRVDPGLLRGH